MIPLYVLYISRWLLIQMCGQYTPIYTQTPSTLPHTHTYQAYIYSCKSMLFQHQRRLAMFISVFPTFRPKNVQKQTHLYPSTMKACQKDQIQMILNRQRRRVRWSTWGQISVRCMSPSDILLQKCFHKIIFQTLLQKKCGNRFSDVYLCKYLIQIKLGLISEFQD